MSKKTWQQRALALINTFSLVLQLVFPALFGLANPAYAADVTPEIDFTKSSNSFKLTAETDQTVKYSIYYLHDDNITEAVRGEDQQSPKFSKTIFAGTCSQGVCVDHLVKKGILKWNIGPLTGAIQFTIDSGKLTINTAYSTENLDLTKEEDAWLNGTDNSPPPLCPAPTPTPTPELAPMSVMRSASTLSSISLPPVNNGCLSEVYGSNVNCTAEDVSIASISNITILDPDGGCISPSDTVTFSATYDVVSNATSRYDVGLYFSSDGDPNSDGAESGQCIINTLPTSPNPPYVDLDKDQCGDITSANSPLNPTYTMTVDCLDADDDNMLDLPYCTSWRQSDDLVCTSPTQASPGTKSKCKCEPGKEIPITVPYAANIEVRKNIIPTSDIGTFNLLIDGNIEKANATNNDTTGKIEVGAGTSASPGDIHDVSESAYGSTDLTKYNSSITCVDRGLETFNGGPALTQIGVSPLNIQTDKNDDIVCTITNTRKAGSLEVKKNVVPDAPTTQWNISVTGPSPITDTLIGDDSTGTQYAAAGTYTINETAGIGTSFNDYASTYSCTKNAMSYISGVGTSIADVVINTGDSIICTFTNTRKYAHLTVVKTVVNDNGGTKQISDFPLFINTTSVTSGTSTQLEPDTYTVSETNQTGYAPSVWGGDCAADGTITLLPGDNKTCTITNDDITPTLTVIKNVVNDNGGTLGASDFNILLNSNSLTFDGGTSVTTTTTYTATPTVAANTSYGLTESDLAGYVEGTWSCKDVSNQQAITLPMTLSEGQNVKCEITNNDIQPKLTVTKVVTNNQYGTLLVSDFPLFVDSTSVTSDDQNGFDAGTYIVSETTQPGYSASVWSGNCDPDGSVTLNVGDVKSCTITNTDNFGKIIIEKQTLPDGSTQSFTFSGDVSGSISDGQQLERIVVPGNYSVSETPVAGWDLSNITCIDPTQNSGVNSTTANLANINLAAGENITCTFTNTQRGSISGQKYNDINGDGDKDAGDIGLGSWTIRLFNETGNGLIATTTTDTLGNYSFSNYRPGNYQVCELVTTAWTNTDPGAGTAATACKSIAITAGQNTVADFGNFELGKITACKYNDYSGNGSYQAAEDLPLANINMILFKNGDGWEQQSIQDTEVNGCTTFTGLTAGTYKIEEDLQDPDLVNYYSTNGITYYDNIQITSASDETRIFLNALYRTISGTKFNDLNGNGIKEAGEIGLGNWTIFIDLNTNGALDASEPSTITNNSGYYEFTNLVSDSYRVAENMGTIQVNDGWIQTMPSQGYYSINLHTAITSTGNDFGNVQLSDIHGFKWEDIDGNGDQNNEEPSLPGWRIFIDDVNENGLLDDGERYMDTSNEAGEHFGWYWFENLLPGTYKICEVQQAGWQQTYPTPICHIISLPYSSEELESSILNYISKPAPAYNFGNQYVTPEMTIEKYNNRWPNPQSPGSDVLYTIVLRVTGNSVVNPIVTDLLPQNVTYRHGSFHATSTMQTLNISEPTYASPGKWYLPTLSAGEVVTLTYIGDTSNDIKPGTYKDLAWAAGTDGKSNRVLASSVATSMSSDDGVITDSLVGTQIIIDSTYKTNASVNIIREEEGKVLGISTELPATGINSLWLFLAAGLITTGTTLQFVARKRKSYASH